MGFGSGFAHPFAGVDHVIVMLAVGVLAALRRGLVSIAVPVSFLGFMVIGAVIGLSGVAVGLVEPMIIASILAVGCLIAIQGRHPVWPMVAIIGFFALFHGAAHGLEIPVTASPVKFAAGFVLGTALLLALGSLLVLAMRQTVAGSGARVRQS
jgi:urease accessory protein